MGFAHGDRTLELDSEVIYKVTANYDPASQRGLAWHDPDVGIDRPASDEAAVLVARDRAYPRLVELQNYFPFELYPDST